MAPIDLLRGIALASAAPAADGLPPRVIRFTLGYASPPAQEVAQAELERFVGAPLPALVPLDPELPTYFVLQFADIPRRISPPALFGVADLLVTEIRGLSSCTPDIGVRGLELPTADDVVHESVVTDPILDLTCKTQNPVPQRRDWAARSVRADKVWTETTGAGVLVAQPDTGVANHPAINEGLDQAHAYDVIANRPGATDPLRAGSGNPGHGTATSSVIIGRAGVSGIAPGATLLPIRAVESVIVFDGAPIARAIMWALRSGAQVITMSLGGLFFSPPLRDALAQAVQRGVIVCAAAGNCIQPIVVYPASDPNVLAVGGVGAGDEPWKGSSHGSKVAFSAPAENVFVAHRAPGDDGQAAVAPSEGTSFATAAAAGVAALWLARHGVDAVRTEAAARGLTVQRLFTLAVTSAGVRPPDTGAWDPRYGAGIIDAERLLSVGLDEIPPAPPAVERAPAADQDASSLAVVEVMARAAEPSIDPDFDWARFGSEAVYLAGDSWRRGRAEQGAFVESALRPSLSRGLAATPLPEVLAESLAAAADQPLVQPPLPRASRRERPASPALLRPTDEPPPTAVLPESTRETIVRLSPNTLLDRAARRFGDLDRARPEGAAERARALDHAERGLDRLRAAPGARLPFEHAMVLEALVRLEGRPAYPVTNRAIQIDPVRDPDWYPSLYLFRVADFAASVGRIDLDGEHVGTGSVVAPGVIMTNRHVLEAIAEEILGPSGSTWFFSRGEPSIDFSDVADGSERFRIQGVVAAGRVPTENLVRFTTLDMVLLDVERQTAAGSLPARLPLALASDISTQKREVVTIGYPARPSTTAMRDPVTGDFRPDVMTRLQELFGLDYGRKYLAPGQIETVRGQLQGDVPRWSFAHDATTLGGNSGSPVAVLGELAVTGLHFGGATLSANYAHSLKAVRESAALQALSTMDAQWL